MALPTIFLHKKFTKLVKRLGLPEPHVLGLLEFMWHASYQTGNDHLGSAEDVAAVARYDGDHQEFAAALLEIGFIDEDGPERYKIHDLYQNAPEYVRKRIKRREHNKLQNQNGTDGGQCPPNGAENCQTEPRGKKRTPLPVQSSPVQEEREGLNVLLLSPDGDHHATKSNQQPTSEELKTVWNSNDCLRHVRDWNAKRSKLLAARRKDAFFREHWREAIDRATRSAFCRGQTPRGTWVADIDWFLKPNTVARLMEGFYDDNHTTRSPPGETVAEKLQRLKQPTLPLNQEGKT